MSHMLTTRVRLGLWFPPALAMQAIGMTSLLNGTLIATVHSSMADAIVGFLRRAHGKPHLGADKCGTRAGNSHRLLRTFSGHTLCGTSGRRSALRRAPATRLLDRAARRDPPWADSSYQLAEFDALDLAPLVVGEGANL